jgi:hypothetical protein
LEAIVRRNIIFTALFVVAVAFSGLYSQSADAAPIRRTWVSHTGNDSNPCTQASPCLTFAGALNNTLDGGAIDCLDAGDYSNAFRIMISVTIDCRDTHGAITINFNTGDGITVQAPGKTVILRGLVINASGNAAGADVGVNISGAKTVIIEDCVIRGFIKGIGDTRSEAGSLIVQDTNVTNNAFSQNSGGGIIINPGAGGSIRATLNRVAVTANSFGIAADGSNSTNGINLTVTNSVISNNIQDGIIATTPPGGAPIGVFVKSSASVNNAFGIRSLGPNVTVRVSDSSIIGNNTGLSFGGGGALLSFSDNQVQANGTTGNFSSSLALQ